MPCSRATRETPIVVSPPARGFRTADFLIFDPGPSWEHHHFADEALKEATQDLLASADDTRCTADLTAASAYALTR